MEDIIVDALIDSVKDTLELVPFLFVTYLAMEAIEHSTEGHVQKAVARSGRLGPLIGALLGALPQCGFSAMAATLYAGRVVTVGTLVAVILATSDEMIPVFVANQVAPGRMLAILAVKVLVGMATGFLVDALMRAVHRTGDGHTHIHELCERAHCHCDEDDGDDGDESYEDPSVDAQTSPSGPNSHNGHSHAHHHHHGHGAIVRSALVHTLQVTGFIFAVTLAFGLLIGLTGQDAIAAFLGRHPVRATALAALVGLIPNCGASVVLSQLYLDGTLAAGPMMAGLLSSGGVGLLVLYRTNTDVRQNLAVTACVLVVGVAVGLVIGASGIIF